MNRFFTILLLFTGIISAQNSSELYDSGNNHYKNGKYIEAISSYTNIINQGESSSELHYNIANSFYKLNKVAPAIYNYEKALLLDRNNTEARHNLAIAKQLTIDRITPLPKTLFEIIEQNLFQKLSFESWGILSIILTLMTVVLFLGYHFELSSSKKRLLFSASLIALLLFITTFTISFQQYHHYKNTKFAIIFTPKATVKNEPTSNSSEIFLLHEGTKVLVIDSVDNWKKIKIESGKTGWLIKDNIKIL